VQECKILITGPNSFSERRNLISGTIARGLDIFSPYYPSPDAMSIVTGKTLKKMGATVMESKGSKVSDFARKQMEKMGWKEGEGLGKDGKGPLI
jgi:G-patch domain